jgi:hypothetical protein
MSASPDQSSEAKGKRLTIFINDHRYQVEDPTMTGAELKAMDSIPPGNTLFLEVSGPDPDQKVGDADEITLKSGMRFYDLPPIQRGDVQQEIQGVQGRYPEVRSHDVPEGTWVSVGVALREGWHGQNPRIAVAVPSAFPEAKPDGFWVTTPLVQPNGGQLGLQREEEGRSWAKLCWQVQLWDPAREHLWRYLKAMERWFTEGWQ